jgi:hypothetical protein
LSDRAPTLGDRANYLRDHLVISEVIGRVVELKKRGNDHFGICPFHNEATGSFSVNDKKKFFHCFGCGEHGDLIGFVMRRQDLDFREAVELLESKNGVKLLTASTPPAAPRVPQAQDPDKLEWINRIWKEARWHPIVAHYLARRHIVPPSSYGCGDPNVNQGWPADLLFHRALWHKGEGREMPAMVAAFRKRPDGPVTALHRTFLKVSGDVVTKAGTAGDKTMFGDVRGSAIWLGPVADRMTGGEGIETTLSAGQIFRRPGLAFGARAGMANFELPFEVDDFWYAADRNKTHPDPKKSRVGERAAWAGVKLNATGGRKCAVKIPNLPGEGLGDFNDALALLAANRAVPAGHAERRSEVEA